MRTRSLTLKNLHPTFESVGVKNAMARVIYRDPQRRRDAKQQSRERDDQALREGLVSAIELRQRNGLLSSLEIVSSSISRRRP